MKNSKYTTGGDTSANGSKPVGFLAKLFYSLVAVLILKMLGLRVDTVTGRIWRKKRNY